jgi:acyl-CoA reductase-like NAD-dependent aldehyde dehydrogenase
MPSICATQAGSAPALPASPASGVLPPLSPSSTAGIHLTPLALRSRVAQSAWARSGIRERTTVLRRLRQRLAERVGDLAEETAALRGCSVAEALVTELIPLADAIQFLEWNLVRVLKPRRPGRRGRPAWLTGVTSEIQRVPHGLVLVIGPGNYPLFLTAVPAVQGLAAGNAVWIKPAPGCAALWGRLRELAVASGIPPHLLVVLPESVETAQAAIAANPDKVVFTGSATTGRVILQQLAPRLIPATLELSGCDAAFVCRDADLELAARALAFGITLNRGATCIAPRRVFVPGDRLVPFSGMLVAELKRRPSIEWSPAETGGLAAVQEALGRGAVLIHGRIRPLPVTGPLVISNARPEMRLLCEDVFAPVMSLVSVTDDEEALIANARCPYALGASVFSRNPAAARSLADRIRAGSVVINDLIVPTADPRMPFGGLGQSGHGVTRGEEGLLEMTVPKVIARRTGRRRPHYRPLQDRDAPLFRALFEVVHGGSLITRLRAVRRLVGFARRPAVPPDSTSAGEFPSTN